jgi:16S rRNA (cytosine1402-N4)-methyltransferase
MNKQFKAYHQPVLLSEVLTHLITDNRGKYLDGTLGGGGHAEAILKSLDETADYIAFDQDMAAINFAKKRLKKYTNVRFIHDNFSNFEVVLSQLNITRLNGVLLDLGLSSHQIDSEERGFSYMKNTALDMRMDQNNPRSAYHLLNSLDENQLSIIFFDYGEERKSRQIARQIIRVRKAKPITHSDELRSIIDKVVHPRYAIKSYARIFQALRIAVNDELDSLKIFLENSFKYLKSGGRYVVISYHSLEDRIVKNFLRQKSNPCQCPPELPNCVCGKSSELKILSKKIIKASEDEIQENPRARSARLRVGEKV